MKFRYSLKKILTINFVLLTSVPIFIIGFVSLSILNHYLTTDIAEKNLLLVKSLCSEVETTIDIHMQTLLQLADLIDMGKTVIPIESINLHLDTINKYHEELEMIRILDSKGVVTHISPFNRNYIGINMSYQPFVRETMKDLKPKWSVTFKSSQTRQPTLALSVPFGQGVVLGYLNLQTLKAIIDKVKIGTFGYAYIVDNEGTFIAHPNESYVAEQMNLKYFPEISRSVGREGTFTFKMQGIEVFSSTAIVPNVNWVITVIQPVDEAMAPVKRIRDIIFTGVLITLAFAIFLLMKILKRILTPLIQLTEYSQKIAAGDDSLLTHQKSFYEVSTLTHNFNLMIKALMHSKEKAETANKAKSLFLANMSHELRTPINAMLGFSKIIKDQHVGPLNNRQYEYLEYIIESSKRLLALIDDILDLSRVEAGKIEITKAVFNIDHLMKRIETTYSFITTQKGLTFQVKVIPDIPRYFISDEYRLEQVLKNLISNALKFTTQGKIEVSVNMKSENELLFEVYDTGIGIPKEKKDSLFDKFFQADSSYAKKFSGAGLGLAISKELVELMGGKIWLLSDVGQGSTFFFTLKVDIPDTDLIDSYEKNHTPAHKNTVSHKRLKILLAEDDKLNSQTMIFFLNKAGHIVTHAVNGNEVLSFLEKDSFDMILMDIQMPDLDGVETTKMIRNSEKAYANIPVVALTAYAMRGDKEKFIGAGMNDYETKPVDINNLLEKINQFAIDNKNTVFDKKDNIKPDEIKLTESNEYENELSVFIDQLGEDVDFQKLMLITFSNDSQKRMDQLDKAITSHDIKKIFSLSHSITGMLASIQIFSISKLSKMLESAARSNEIDRVEMLYQDLKEQMNQITNYIQLNYLSNQS
jgi:signal transduction histidine kinase/DNA-binding response OmpR family regulator